MTDIVKPDHILDFWVDAGPKKWWKKDSSFDAEIALRFGSIHLEAANRFKESWLETPDSTLALIIVLDQFSRNLFRNSPHAFAQDAYCRDIVKAALAEGSDKQARKDIGEFFYLPLMHSENISDQKLCLMEMERIGKENNVKSAKQHLEIIAKFGRFPHRNEVLGRQTTTEEQAFLDAGGFSG